MVGLGTQTIYIVVKAMVIGIMTRITVITVATVLKANTDNKIKTDTHLIQCVKWSVVSQVAVAASVSFICSKVGNSSSSLAFTFARNSKTLRVSGP